MRSNTWEIDGRQGAVQSLAIATQSVDSAAHGRIQLLQRLRHTLCPYPSWYFPHQETNPRRIRQEIVGHYPRTRLPRPRQSQLLNRTAWYDVVWSCRWQPIHLVNSSQPSLCDMLQSSHPRHMPSTLPLLFIRRLSDELSATHIRPLAYWHRRDLPRT